MTSAEFNARVAWRRLDYIKETARSISYRLLGDSPIATGIDVDHLADDVAWLARSLADLADAVQDITQSDDQQRY